MAENRRIDEVEYDRNQMEYEMDRKWMAEELAALDLEEKLKWLQDETEQMEEIGERWDRLGPYTESDFEILQVANTVEEEEKDLPGPLMPARGKRKRRRGGRLTLRKKKRAKVERVPEKEKEEKYVYVFCVTTYRIIVIVCIKNV